MTTQDMLRERARGAAQLEYDPNEYTFDDTQLRAAGLKVFHVARHKSRDGKTKLTLRYPGGIVA